jgi:hypothetical protein
LRGSLLRFHGIDSPIVARVASHNFAGQLNPTRR